MGLVDHAFGEHANSIRVCHTNITLIANSSVQFVKELTEHTPESLEASAISFESLLSALYPITYACYMSGFEFADVTKMYIATFSSAERVLYNLMHKVGTIYDTVYSILKHH